MKFIFYLQVLKKCVLKSHPWNISPSGEKVPHLIQISKPQKLASECSLAIVLEEVFLTTPSSMFLSQTSESHKNKEHTSTVHVHSPSGPLSLMENLSTEYTWSHRAGLSAIQITGCTAAEISPIMVVLGKLFERTFSHHWVVIVLLICLIIHLWWLLADPLPQSTFNGLSVRRGQSSPMSQLYFIMVYYCILFRDCLQNEKVACKTLSSRV